MFCSLDMFRYVLAYAISCSETILSQYVRIVDICLVLGYLVFLAQNVVSQCSDVFCSLDIHQNNTHRFTRESKVSSCFTVPVLPLRISSKHCVDISFSKRNSSIILDFGSSPGARTKTLQ